jgi:hypothetical protein
MCRIHESEMQAYQLQTTIKKYDSSVSHTNQVTVSQSFTLQLTKSAVQIYWSSWHLDCADTVGCQLISVIL